MGFYGLAAALLAVAVAISGSIGDSKGAASRNPEIVELQAAIEASKKIAAEWEATAAAKAAKVVTVYKDRVKVIREEVPGDTQIIEVIKRDSTCLAPPAFRVLHDRAASGGPAVENPAGTDAAAVPIEDIAATVAENYRIARENAARLEALQALVASQ